MVGRIGLILLAALSAPAAAMAGEPVILSSASPEEIRDRLLPGHADDGALTRGLLVQPVGASIQAPDGAKTVNAYGDTLAATVNLAVTFRLNSAELTPEARALLDSLGAALESPDLAPHRFVVGGHTDATGAADANLALSERRAAAAIRYLEERFGIAADRLTLRAFGETALLFPDQPTDGRNRRVEISTLR
ncbi:OmpA family protein [Ensifer soli]|uniref:OmpA family protein n=1 Tax=Ciceribacter sp. sgz301302 TaxID=3342379 RepID=UPI0035BA9D7F